MARVRTRRRTALAAATLVVALGAYAGWYHLFPGPEQPALAGDDPRILVQQRPALGGMEVFAGTLRYAPDTGCLFVESAGGVRSGVAWPKGTRPIVEDDRAGVRVRAFLGRIGGTTLRDGDEVRLGGGEDSRTGELAAGPECAYDGLFRVTRRADLADPLG
jgi:hypothetical protein